MTNDPVLSKTAMSDQAFSVLGGGKIAYVKPIRSEDVHDLYPQAPELQPGLQLRARNRQRPLDRVKLTRHLARSEKSEK
jgi:hypothetical protein